MLQERIAPAMTYGGGTGALIFGYDANTVGMVAGVLIGVLGLLLTWHYKRKEDGRRQAAHDLHMILKRDQLDLEQQGEDE
jgi:Na+/glutamate symporter